MYFGAFFLGGDVPGFLTTRLGAARDGSWLSVDRIRTYSTVAVLVYLCLACVMLYAQGNPAFDVPRPFPRDSSQVWAAGKAVLDGHPLAPYNLDAHEAHMRALFGPKAPLFVWVYPPFCLPVAALLALMPYLLSVAVEQLLMLALYAASIRTILPGRLAILGALGLPSVIVNIGYGQIATLTAGLAGAAVMCLERRPALAGVLFGCMAYKPQLGLAIPVALIAGRRWTTLAAASATVTLLVAASTAAYGWPAWLDFLDSMHTAGDVVFRQGIVDWFKIQSVFAAVRMLGGGVAIAWVAQGAATLLALAAIARTWSLDGDIRLKAALLLVAGLLCTPYCFEYDTVVFGPAIALAVSYGLERGFPPWQKTLLALIWISPLFAGLVAHVTRVPLGMLTIAGFGALLLRTMAAGRRDAPVPAPAPSMRKRLPVSPAV